MATQEYAASIQGVSIRVTRLDAAGNLLNGAGDSYTTSAFMRVSFTPEYEEGDEITEKSANGTVCVTYKAPDTLKRITMELAICEPDAELSQLLSGGLLLRKNVDGVVKSVGWAAPGVGDDPAGNGVAIEAWSHAVKDGKRASVLPYFHWVFPYAKLRQSGDRVIENGMLASTFEGYGLGNRNFGAGADGRWEFPVAAERPYSYARASWAPVGLQGFYTWTDKASEAVFFTAGGNIQGQTILKLTPLQLQQQLSLARHTTLPLTTRFMYLVLASRSTPLLLVWLLQMLTALLLHTQFLVLTLELQLLTSSLEFNLLILLTSRVPTTTLLLPQLRLTLSMLMAQVKTPTMFRVTSTMLLIAMLTSSLNLTKTKENRSKWQLRNTQPAFKVCLFA